MESPAAARTGRSDALSRSPRPAAAIFGCLSATARAPRRPAAPPRAGRARGRPTPRCARSAPPSPTRSRARELAARRHSGCARELAKTSDINVNSAPGAGAAGGQQPPAPLAGRSETVTDARAGPLDAAMAAAAPRIAAPCALVRRGSAGASCAGRCGRGTALAAGGGVAGPRCGRSGLRSRSDPDARRTASQISCNRRSEGGLSLLVNRVSRRVARPTLDGAKSASPRCRMLTGAGRCLCHRRRQSGSVRLPRKLFLNPAPLGCHHLISIFL